MIEERSDVGKFIESLGFKTVEFHDHHATSNADKVILLMTSMALKTKDVIYTTSEIIIEAMTYRGLFCKENNKDFNVVVMPILVCFKGDDFTYLSDMDTLDISLRRFLTMESPQRHPVDCTVCLDPIPDSKKCETCPTCFNLTCKKCIQKGKIENCPLCKTRMMDRFNVNTRNGIVTRLD